MKSLVLFLSMLFLVSCGGSSYEKPDFYFEGAFKPSLVDDLEAYVKELAGDKNFRVFEKDRDQMKVLTQGEDALYMSLYKGSGDKPVLWVSNVGTGMVLTLGLLSNDSFSLADTKKLSDEVILYLKKEMDVEMSAVSPNAEK